MGNWFEDYSYSIGNTPMVRINHITQGAKATVLAKVEGRNPSFSVKCRIGAAMIWDAEMRGKLVVGKEIVEPTSGNTGIALAFVGASRGYKVNLAMPETMSLERRKVLAALGANVILTEGKKGMRGAIEKARAMVDNDPIKYFMPQQFDNPANPGIHEETTGPEIWADTAGEIDVLVAGVGTGGTITGISRYMKCTREKQITTIAVEPAESPVLTQSVMEQEIKPGPHMIQGIGAGFIPNVLDMSLVDRVETVNSEQAFEYAKRLAQEEGILAGISCGAAIAVADRIARLDEFEGKVIVTILPDAAERYLSTSMFTDITTAAAI